MSITETKLEIDKEHKQLIEFQDEVIRLRKLKLMQSTIVEEQKNMGLNFGPLRSANNQEEKQLGNLVAGKTKAKTIDEPIEEEYYYDEEEEEEDDDENANIAAVIAYERGGGGLQFQKGPDKNGKQHHNEEEDDDQIGSVIKKSKQQVNAQDVEKDEIQMAMQKSKEAAEKR